MEKTVLLASFIDRSERDTTLAKIKESFVIVNSKVFVLRNKENTEKLILTYNIFLDESSKVRFDTQVRGTINIQRKMETNTLYTLNALNEVVKMENNGELDKKHIIKWTEYRNCILLTQKNKGLLRIDTELEEIINLGQVN